MRLPAHLARLARARRRSASRSTAGRWSGRLAAVAGAGAAAGAADAGAGRRGAVTAAPLPRRRSRGMVVRVAEERLAPDDPWLRVKTSRAAALRRGAGGAAGGGGRGDVAEPARRGLRGDDHQRLCRPGDGLVTPPLACGLLPGVLRAELLARGACREAVLRRRIWRAGRLWVGNSLRGLIPARLGDAGLTAAGWRGVSARDLASRR